MRTCLSKSLLFLAILFAPSLYAASGPNDRQATDPKTIVSPSSPDARPVPVDDLYYSRRVSGPAWSPDGKQIAFTTNFTGRFNLWKVDANGVGPSSFCNRTTARAVPSGLRMASGLFIARMLVVMKSTISMPFPARVASHST